MIKSFLFLGWLLCHPFLYGESASLSIHSSELADEEELALLAKGPHAYGSHGSLTKRKPPFTLYTLPAPQPAYDWREERDRMYNRPGVGRPGMSQGPSDFGSRLAAAFAPASMPMMSSGGELRLQEVNVAATLQGGITRVGGAVTLASPMGDISLGDTTLGFNYRSGEGTRSLDLFSTFVPPTLAESIRLATMGIDPTAPNAALALHTMASAAILQLTDRSSRMNAAAVATAIRVGVVAHRVSGTIKLGSAVSEMVERGRDHVDAATSAEGKAKSETGGPKGERPEDEDPRWSKKQNLNAKQKEALKDVPLRGRNPGNVVGEAGRVEVDTELLGGERAAREFFKQKTGVEVPEVVAKDFPVYKEGIRYGFRPTSTSGPAKVDINDPVTLPGKTILEKITFK